MATKFKVESAQGKKWTHELGVSYDTKEEAIMVAEFICLSRNVETRVKKVQTKTVWQSKKPETDPPK